MVSDARKQAWLGGVAIQTPGEKFQAFDQDTREDSWHFIWKFQRQGRQLIEYRLLYDIESRRWRAFSRPSSLERGRRSIDRHQLAPLLRSLLPAEQLSTAIATSLTRNHAQGRDP